MKAAGSRHVRAPDTAAVALASNLQSSCRPGQLAALPLTHAVARGSKGPRGAVRQQPWCAAVSVACCQPRSRDAEPLSAANGTLCLRHSAAAPASSARTVTTSYCFNGFSMAFKFRATLFADFACDIPAFAFPVSPLCLSSVLLNHLAPLSEVFQGRGPLVAASSVQGRVGTMLGGHEVVLSGRLPLMVFAAC